MTPDPEMRVDWEKLSPQAQLEIAEIIRREGVASEPQERKIPGRSGFKVVSGPATNMQSVAGGMKMSKPVSLPRHLWGRLPNLKDPR